MGWPQITWLALSLLGLGIYLARHGKPREDFYNFWLGLFATLLNAGILYAGGFFN